MTTPPSLWTILRLAGILALFNPWFEGNAQPSTDSTSTKPLTTSDLAAAIRDAVVIISVEGRGGGAEGVGSGFIINEDGLIATSLHVIGETRPIRVELLDGRQFRVTEIHAWSREHDLAVIRIPASGLPVIPLGDPEAIRQGSRVVAMGNPHGLNHSIVEGVVSAMRDLETQMIQVAIPVEPGNSGGPLLDSFGRVQGIMTMKSAVTDNLGFAMPVQHLKDLLDHPNTIPIAGWLTIGALDPNRWTLVFGGNWGLKAGRITVDEPGEGFGGRALCLRKQPPTQEDIELGVHVRLGDESGAAGLVFCSDGKDRHYGFYPSGGQLRLTRFEGPSVFNWTILEQAPSDNYRPGEWNHLKVRLESDGIRCFVNDREVFFSPDTEIRGGQAGLCKFRQTRAEFRGLEWGPRLPPVRPTEAQSLEVLDWLKLLPDLGKWHGDQPPPPELPASTTFSVLQEQARELERRAEMVRKLAVQVHQQAIVQDIQKLFANAKNSPPDLIHACLLISKLDNPELDLQSYFDMVDRLSQQIQDALPKDANDQDKLATLTRFLFEEHGFHGSHSDYYNRANSYINDVLDDRQGLPITLSILFMELGNRIGIRKLVGLPIPGHFIVQYLPEKGEAEFIDPYDEGRVITLAEAAKLARERGGATLQDEHLIPASETTIITRVLRNLVSIAFQREEPTGPIRYLDLILAIDPSASMERWGRAMLRLQAGQNAAAKEDFAWLLEHQPRGIDLDRVLEIYNSL